MIKVVFWGTPQFAVPSLQRLILEPDFELKGVVTQPDKRRGRGNKLLPSPIKTLALEHQLPIWQPQRVNKHPATLAELQALAADAFVVVAYGQILSTKVLAMPRLGAINSHASCLPQYRGAAPIQWMLYDGQTQAGVTTMMMDKGMDTGDILLTSKLEIGPLWTVEQLSCQLALHSADLLVETLRQLDRHCLKPIPQDHTQATYARLINKSDYALDWSRSAIDLHNQIRAFSPNGVAHFRSQALKISLAIPINPHYLDAESAPLRELMTEIAAKDFSQQAPGTTVQLVKNWGPIVKTGQGLLLLRELQLAGRKRQKGWDFVNGIRLQVGDRFEDG